MTRNQTIVMWAGLIILCVYLFTDKNFKDTIFGKKGNTQLVSDTNVPSVWDFPQQATMPAPKKATTL